MFKILSSNELTTFVEKYMPIWGNDIIKVSMIELDDVKEYLVNDHYLVTVYPDRVITKDLQFYN